MNIDNSDILEYASKIAYFGGVDMPPDLSDITITKTYECGCTFVSVSWEVEKAGFDRPAIVSIGTPWTVTDLKVGFHRHVEEDYSPSPWWKVFKPSTVSKFVVSFCIHSK